MGIATLVLLLAAPTASAWNHHYLVSDRTLRHPEAPKGQPVAVEALEAFLLAEASGVAEVFNDFGDWGTSRESARFQATQFDAADPSVVAFLRAARLNQAAEFKQVRRLLPGEEAPDALPSAAVSPHIKAQAALRAEFVGTEPGSMVDSISVVSTYCDEPDWGFDHALFVAHPEYGYGEIPYGKPSGESSKAAFHMLFAHENFLLTTLAPEVTEGMVVERMELFVRLSRLAFATEHPYWGYRFAAWAIHYAQDLSQPYHSTAVPHATLGYYFSFAVSSDKEAFKSEATTIAGNRHFLYEDFVAFSLQDGYLNPTKQSRRLAATLHGEGDIAQVDTVEQLVDQITAAASAHAWHIDHAVQAAFGPKLTEDPSYDLDTAQDYDVGEVVGTMDPELGAGLLRETALDFAWAGRATRTILELVGSKP
jgi:hypothetical protein